MITSGVRTAPMVVRAAGRKINDSSAEPPGLYLNSQQDIILVRNNVVTMIFAEWN